MDQDDQLNESRYRRKDWSWIDDDGSLVDGDMNPRLRHEELHLFFDALISVAYTNDEFVTSLPDHLAPASRALGHHLLRTCCPPDVMSELQKQQWALHANTTGLTFAVALLTQAEQPTFIQGRKTRVQSICDVDLNYLRKIAGTSHTYIVPADSGRSGDAFSVTYTIPEGLLNYFGNSLRIESALIGNVPVTKAMSIPDVANLFNSLDDSEKQLVILNYLKDDIIPLCQNAIRADLVEDLPGSTCDFFLDEAIPLLAKTIDFYSRLLTRNSQTHDFARTFEALGKYAAN